jgi:hypothetical protein
MGQHYSTAYNKGGDAVFCAVTSREPIKESMNILVGTIVDNKIVIKPPKMNILNDLMDVLEAQYKGVLAIDMNHCVFFMDKAGIMDFSTMFPLIVFIPLKDNTIESMYEESAREVKLDPEGYTKHTEDLYTQIDAFMANAYSSHSKKLPFGR